MDAAQCQERVQNDKPGDAAFLLQEGNDQWRMRNDELQTTHSLRRLVVFLGSTFAKPRPLLA
jgi:hypothetical protein